MDLGTIACPTEQKKARRTDERAAIYDIANDWRETNELRTAAAMTRPSCAVLERSLKYSP